MSGTEKSSEYSSGNKSGNKLVTRQPRYFHLDWLRVMVILNLIPFHVAWMMVFIPGFAQIPSNSIVAEWLSIYVNVISPLHMPLLFFISGYSSALALQKKQTISYLRERLQRLILPLISFMLLLSPVYYYFRPRAIQEHNWNDFLFEFLPNFLTTAFNGNSGGPRWAHLWFVGYLSLFTFISLPLFLSWKNPQVRGRLTKLFSYPVGIFMPILLFTCASTLSLIWPITPPRNLVGDWAYFSYYLTAFLLGYIMFLDQAIEDVIDHHLRLWICLWSIVAVIMVSLHTYLGTVFSKQTFSGQFLLCCLLVGLNTWSGIAATLGLSKKYLCFSNPFLDYMSRASYMYYILHLVVLVIVGYLTPRPEGVFSEFFLLSFLTLVWTAFVYEFIVKRLAILRWLFGIKSAY